MNTFAITGARIFTGAGFVAGRALLVRDGRVAALPRVTEAPRPHVPADGLTLAPGLIDWQVNGGGGVLFNADPTPEAAAGIAAAHAAFGVTALLPTVITDAPAVTRAAGDAVAAAIAAGVPGIVGLHCEGPHIAPARKGAHDPAHIRPVTAADIDFLGRGDMGRVVCTLAPEAAGPDDIGALAARGVVVSLGHSDTDHDTAMASFAAGARAVTHLFNAMSPLSHREPGLVGAALDHPEVTAGLIADGHHVHPAALRLAIAAMTPGRLTLVTDAMPTVGITSKGGAGPASFHLGGREIRRRDGRLTLADGTLAGSDLDMMTALRFCVRTVGVSLANALRMASLVPARLLGLEHDRGHLRPGARADVIAFDRHLHLHAVWIGGEPVRPGGRPRES